MRKKVLITVVVLFSLLCGCSSVPVGTIIPYAGSIHARNRVPQGWLLCDGRALSSTANNGKYKELYNVIDKTWGDGTKGEGAKPKFTNFNLPDLRGMFLRGYNGGRVDMWADPDGRERTKIDGTTSFLNVGSYQKGTLESHSHGIYWYDSEHPVTTPEERVNAEKIADLDAKKENIFSPIRKTGGSETRPNNVYVNYLIKY